MRRLLPTIESLRGMSEIMRDTGDGMMTTALKTILYVEDEPDIQTIAKIALEDIGGFAVRICSSGEEALAVLGNFKPDCILLDVMMPGMDGPHVLKALRQIPGCTTVPVIFMTAKVRNSEISEYKGLGALGVIPKPFDPMTLGERVRQIVEAGCA